MTNISGFPILLVEDDSTHVHQVQEALSRANLVNPLRVVEDGEQAIAYLSEKGAALPSLVLLDLTLPRLSGLDVLKWIRTEPRLANLPVILLTSPDDGNDLARSRELGATSCVIKPVSVGGLQALMKSMDVYWMLLDRAPGSQAPETPLTGLMRPYRVLVIDPDIDFLRGISEALRRRTAAMIVEVASGAAEAMDHMTRNAPDAVVFARDIEGDDGLKFLARVRAADINLPVLVMSGIVNEAAAALALEGGARGFLVKDIRLDRFADHLNDALVMARRPVVEPKPAVAVKRKAPARKLKAHRSQDTDIMGVRIDFQETSWDLVASAREAGPLDALVRVYWKPLYFFVRQQGFDNEAAKDVIQDFLLSVLKHDTILKADRTRGRFRTYLLATLGNFLKDRYRSSARRKRGGGKVLMSLDSESFSQDHLRVDDSRNRPETVVDRAWARDVLTKCIAKLRGKPSHLEAFGLNMDGMEYEKISKKTGLGEAAAKTAVHRLRRKLRGIIRGHVGTAGATEEEIGAQINEFSSLLG